MQITEFEPALENKHSHVFCKMLASLLRGSTCQDACSQTRKPLFKRKECSASLSYQFRASEAVYVLMKEEGLSKAAALLQIEIYLGAHLLHSPGNRALRNSPKNHTRLQPTAKGFGHLQLWYAHAKSELDMDIQNVLEEALSSAYNTMKVIPLARSLLTNTIKVSTGLAMVLWTRLMGQIPHQYDSANRSIERLPPAGPVNSTGCDTNSPYFVRSMIHPNSLNLMQYWDSTGMRIFRNLRFERQGKTKFSSCKEYTVDFVISGHAILQWIMDCTSVWNIQEGVKIATMICTSGFLKQIHDPLVDALAAVSVEAGMNSNHGHSGDFSMTALYRLTPRGCHFCPWEHLIDEAQLDVEDIKLEYSVAEARLNNSEVLNNRDVWSFEHQQLPDIDGTFCQLVDFRLIQNEPGLKILFLEELERLKSTEILVFIDAAQQLLLLIRAAAESDSHAHRIHLEQTIQVLLDRLCKHFVEVDSPFELNLSEKDRVLLLEAASLDKLTSLVIHLSTARHRCIDLLRDAIVSFKTSDKMREIPSLRTYVISRFYTQAPAELEAA